MTSADCPERFHAGDAHRARVARHRVDEVGGDRRGDSARPADVDRHVARDGARGHDVVVDFEANRVRRDEAVVEAREIVGAVFASRVWEPLAHVGVPTGSSTRPPSAKSASHARLSCAATATGDACACARRASRGAMRVGGVAVCVDVFMRAAAPARYSQRESASSTTRTTALSRWRQGRRCAGGRRNRRRTRLRPRRLSLRAADAAPAAPAISRREPPLELSFCRAEACSHRRPHRSGWQRACGRRHELRRFRSPPSPSSLRRRGPAGALSGTAVRALLRLRLALHVSDLARNFSHLARIARHHALISSHHVPSPPHRSFLLSAETPHPPAAPPWSRHRKLLANCIELAAASQNPAPRAQRRFRRVEGFFLIVASFLPLASRFLPPTSGVLPAAVPGGHAAFPPPRQAAIFLHNGRRRRPM